MWDRARLCKLQKGPTRLAAAGDKVYQLFPMVDGSLRVLRFLPPLKLVAMKNLKVVLNTKNQSINFIICQDFLYHVMLRQVGFNLLNLFSVWR